MTITSFRLRWWACTLLMFGFPGCNKPCPPLAQTVYVDAPDETLRGLIADCTRNTSAWSCAQDERSCVCRPLCLRLLQLIDGFDGSEELQTCYADPYGGSHLRSTDESKLRFTDDAIAVALTYIPSRCDVQAH